MRAVSARAEHRFWVGGIDLPIGEALVGEHPLVSLATLLPIELSVQWSKRSELFRGKCRRETRLARCRAAVYTGRKNFAGTERRRRGTPSAC